MWILIRAVTYSTLFVGFLLVFLPTRVLAWSGITPVPMIGVWQVVGIALASIGGAIALWCILTFVFLGKGTPAPFDPPRRLVICKFIRRALIRSATSRIAFRHRHLLQTYFAKIGSADPGTTIVAGIRGFLRKTSSFSI